MKSIFKKILAAPITLKLILALSVSAVTLGTLDVVPHNQLGLINNSSEIAQSQVSQSDQPEVLGSNYYSSPQIYIYGGDQTYSAGGLITLASTEEPAVNIGGYNISGEAQIDLYETTPDAALDFLLHDKTGKKINRTVNIDGFRYVAQVKHNINTSYDGTKVPLPLGEKGIWYLKIKLGKVLVDAFVSRSDVGILNKEGDNQFIFWGQNFKTKRSISAGTIKLLNLQDQKKELQTVSFSAEGLALANMTEEADVAYFEQDDNKVIVPINLRYLSQYGSDYKSFKPKSRQTEYFIFTDRPIYLPGDIIYFKSILRDEDDVRFSVPSGEAKVSISKGFSESDVIFKKSFPISSDGTIDGQFSLPKNSRPGYYRLLVQTPGGNSSEISFNVEYYRKPEYSIDIKLPTTKLISGDNTSFKITGSYFSGQPLKGQSVKYKVYASDFYEYEYLADRQYEETAEYWYGFPYGTEKVLEGTATFNEKGEADISVPTKLPSNDGKSKVFSIEATLDDNPASPSYSRKNLLVLAGEYSIYQKDYSYGAKPNTQLSIPLGIIANRNNINLASVNLTAKIRITNWTVYQDPNQKYPQYREENEDLSPISFKTDQSGNATLQFVPKKTGSYKITVEGKDSKNNTITKIFYSYISSEDYPYYPQGESKDLTINPDKQRYEPTDTAKLDIHSEMPDRDIFLSFERGRVNRYQIVKLNGKNTTVEVPLVDTDIPNIFAVAESFSTNKLDSANTNLLVNSDSKKLLVSVTPDHKTYGPGETVTLNVSSTDSGGRPVSADVALWAVDKAIFELSDSTLGDIFKTFWYQRYLATEETNSLQGIVVQQAEMGGGCFAEGTKVLMADNSQKNIEDIKAGDFVLTKKSATDKNLVKAKILKVEKASETGYLIINGNLKITTDHILWVNGTWQVAGNIQVGDRLTSENGSPVKVESVQWQAGKFDVYNLEIENYHTFFASGIWVHNQKGIERSLFKDTAYWNPSVHTDGSGHAEIRFKLSDNLTTWVIAGVGSTQTTQVGQTTAEVTVSKDLVVRPILPNILRVGDELVLNALVQNFTQKDSNFDISLSFDSGEVNEATYSAKLIKQNDSQEFSWHVKATKENEKGKLIFAARSKDDPKLADVVTQEIPVKKFGFEDKRAEAGISSKEFILNLSSSADKEKSSVTLSLAPTILGTIPQAMKYLIDYPYGCVEQTTSRFVPAVIAKLNPKFFGVALEDKDLDDIIQKSLSRLSTLQRSDGGWTWWFTGSSNPFITSYVVEYILQAKNMGLVTDDQLLLGAQGYLEQIQPADNVEKVSQAYALTLLGSDKRVKSISEFEGFEPDILSLAVMTNYLNGQRNPDVNGLSKLQSMAKTQGDGVFWEGSSNQRFGSNDASTAYAVRAILLAGGDRDLAAKGVKYLIRNKRYDYWSNTFATSQVIKALVELSKTGNELTPNYTYSVNMDGNPLTSGLVNSSSQNIKDIIVPQSKIKPSGSKLNLTQNGEGQLYSTLQITEFNTDKNAKAINHGLMVKREYVNDKGYEYSIGLGDTVTVNITVSGLSTPERYGVIVDELPSGLVPINPVLKNQEFGYGSPSYPRFSDITETEITQNGAILSVYELTPTLRVYSYKARAVAQGDFFTPPASAALMYSPETYGRTGVQFVQVDREARIIPERLIKQSIGKDKQRQVGVILVVLILIMMSASIYIREKGISLRDLKEKFLNLINRKPPQPPLTPNDSSV